MKNKAFLILIGLALTVALIGFCELVLTNFESGTMLLNSGSSLLNLLGFIILLKNGTILKTIYMKVIYLFLAIVMFGSMFKITQWPGANMLLLIGLLGISITYTVRFIHKSTKAPLDILKLILVITFFTMSYAVTVHWLPRMATYLPNIMMLGTIIYFATICVKDKTLLEQ